MNILGTFTAPAGDSKRIDFNWRSVRIDTPIVIESEGNLTLTLKDGVGNADPDEVSGAVPYVEDGSSVPVYDGTGTAYAIVANVNKKINFKRREIGDWVSFDFDNATGADIEFTIYSSLDGPRS